MPMAYSDYSLELISHVFTKFSVISFDIYITINSRSRSFFMFIDGHELNFLVFIGVHLFLSLV